MLEALLAEIQGSGLATHLRFSRWSYAAVNGLHILGIAALVGSVIPLNLKLLGLWPGIPLASAARLLVPVAASGLLLAISCGLLLFSTRAQEYAALEVLQAKLLLLLLGSLSAAAFHWRHGLALESASLAGRRLQAALSLACWLGALFLGRLIAFVTA